MATTSPQTQKNNTPAKNGATESGTSKSVKKAPKTTKDKKSVKKKTGRTKAPPSVAWTDAQWEQWMKTQLFTFSSKMVNSNAEAVGIRIGVLDHAKHLPYVTTQSCNVSGDYLHQKFQTASKPNPDNRAIYSELKQHLGKMPPDKFVPQVKQSVADLYHQVMQTHYEDNTLTVPSRVRQVLLPHSQNGEMSYLSVSPLASSGMGEYFTQSVNEYKEQIKKQTNTTEKNRWPTLIEMPWGGANSQNIGGLTYLATNALVINLPIQDPNIRFAFSIKHKGFVVKLDRTLVSNYFLWLDKQTVFTQSLRNTEQKHLKAIIDGVKNKAQWARNVLDDLPSDVLNKWDVGHWSELTMKDEDMGWLLASNSPVWRDKAAKQLLKLFESFVYKTDNEEPVYFQLAEHKSRLLKQFKEVLA